MSNLSVEAICINDKNKPAQIPSNKWLKLGQKYSIIYTVLVLPQRKVGATLSEIELDDSCLPYEYFLLNRFGFTKENLKKLMELIKECTESDFSLSELIEQTELIEA